MPDPIVIVGTGLAGYQLARELRKIDTTSPLYLITADQGSYYSKPLLSNALTQGKTAEALATATAETMASQLNATIETNSPVSHIDPQKKMLFYKDRQLAYSKLILACGAEVIKPPLTGDAVADVLSINHLYHYSQFRDLIKNKKKIVILGAGLIACEFANDLSNAGFEVHLVAPVNSPLNLLIPEKIGKILQSALEKKGVQFHFNCIVNCVNKMSNGHYVLELSNQEKLEAEFILSAIGLKPHTELAATSGLVINRGVVVNRYLETSQADIYALGDCAEVEGHVLPYITPLLNCSRALARTLTGTPTAVDYPAMPIVVKTPAHPVVVCPPPKNMEGDWEIEIQENHTRALFYNTEKKLYGFVLTNEAVKERMLLAKEIPGLF